MKQFFSTKKGKVLTIIAGALLLLFAVSTVMTLIPHTSGPSATGGTLSSIVTNPPHGERARDYAVLYEQDGLTALYLGYTHEGLTPIEIDGGYDYAWKNYVAGGKDARLYNANAWHVLNDGIGYKFNLGDSISEDRRVACEIPYDLSSVTMPSGYEVETVASFYGVLSADTSGLFRQWFFNTDNAGIHTGDRAYSPFRIGLLHTMSYMTLHENPNYSYANRWYLSNYPYSMHYNVDDADTICLLPWDLTMQKHNKSDEHWNPITMNVMCVARSSGYQYGVYYNYKGDSIYSVNSDILSASRVAELESFASRDSGFRLFDNYSGAIYAVRLYDRVLTEAERQRNAFVDLCGFYSINVSSFSRIPADKLDAFLEACGELADLRNVTMTTGYVLPFSEDADLKALADQNRTKVYEIINECWPK